MAPKVVLVGMPGSGKSTIGRRLAKALGVPLLDTDIQIVETTGRSIADIFTCDGEQEFRRIEEQVVRAALAEHDGVVSLGGGAITTAGVRAALAGHTVVYLEINVAEGVRRTTSGTVRPLLAGADPAEKYRTLMAERVPLYRQVATLRVNTNRRNPGSVVRYLASRLENPLPPRQIRRRRRAPWRLSPQNNAPQNDAPQNDAPQNDAPQNDRDPDTAQPAEPTGVVPPQPTHTPPTQPRHTPPTQPTLIAPTQPTPATPAALAARRAEARK